MLLNDFNSFCCLLFFFNLFLFVTIICIYIYIYLQLTKAEKAGKIIYDTMVIIVSQVIIVGMEISLSNAVSIGVRSCLGIL